jgi:hypothetical protein
MLRRRGSAVGLEAGYGLDDRGFGVRVAVVSILCLYNVFLRGGSFPGA